MTALTRSDNVGQDGILQRVVNPPDAGYQPARRLTICPTGGSIDVY